MSKDKIYDDCYQICKGSGDDLSCMQGCVATNKAKITNVNLPTGEEWRDYYQFNSRTDAEYIVNYNINNIIYLYNQNEQLISLIGNLDDLVDPIPQTNLVDAINFVYQNGGGEGTIYTEDLLATDSELEGGENQYIINLATKDSINDLSNQIISLQNSIDLSTLVDPIPQTSVADAINYVWQNGASGETILTTNVNTVDTDLEGGTTQQEVNQNNKQAIDDINTEIDSIINGEIPIEVSIETIDTIATDPTNEGGVNQNAINLLNKQSIDNLNTEVSNIIDGTTPIEVSVNTIDVIATDPDLEGGANQSVINQTNKTSIDNLNSEVSDINEEITNITNGTTPIPVDLSNYYNKSEVDSLIASLQTQINDLYTCTGCDITSPSANITNIIPTDVSTIDGNDGTITFDVNIANFNGVGTAVLDPIVSTTPLTLTNGDNLGLIFENLSADTYTIKILDDSTEITSATDIVINNPDNGGGDLIPLTPEADDGNNKTDGTTVDDYSNYDILITKNNSVDYVSFGLMIGKEIAVSDLNQSGVINTNNKLDLVFNDTTTFNTSITNDDYLGIYYIKAITNPITEISTRGEYKNGDEFSWIDGSPIGTYNMIIQKYYDATRDNFSYTLWESNNSDSNVYLGKNAAETAGNYWSVSNNRIEEGIAEDSYLEIIYGFNVSEIANITTSSTGSTFTLSDFSSYDFLMFKFNCFNCNGNWLIPISEIIQDGTTKYSYGNYNANYFTILDNVITWYDEGGLAHFELLEVKGVKL